MRRAALLLAAALAIAGCGGDDAGGREQEVKRSARLVDFSKKPPYVNGLDIDPQSKDFLLTTNRGFWRIGRESGKVERLKGTIAAGGKRSTVGTFLFVLPAGPGHLIGSGHPDQQGTLPSFLGFIESRDNGKTWSVVSRLGDADLHKIILRHNKMYAFDAVLSAMLISTDGGKSFEEHFTPRGLIIDFEVDPENPEYLVAANEDELFRSEDSGERWRPLTTGKGIRLAWPAPGKLYRAGKDGVVYISEDRGQSWKQVGKVDGEPYKFKAMGPEELYLALSDGTIEHTTDGGKSWDDVFRP